MPFMNEQETEERTNVSRTVAQRVINRSKALEAELNDLDKTVRAEAIMHEATLSDLAEQREATVAEAARTQRILDAVDRPASTAPATPPSGERPAPVVSESSAPLSGEPVDLTPEPVHAEFEVTPQGQHYIFDASASTGTNLHFEWRFGENSLRADQPKKVRYRFPRSETARNWTVRLTVSNPEGQRDACEQIVLVPALHGSTVLPAGEEPVPVAKDKPTPANGANRVQPKPQRVVRRRLIRHPRDWDGPERAAAVVGLIIGLILLASPLFNFPTRHVHRWNHLHAWHPLYVLGDIVWDVVLVVGPAAILYLIVSLLRHQDEYGEEEVVEETTVQAA